MDSYKHLILGGGMVAGYAVQQMLEDGVAASDIGIVSADNAPPYERPPLSKGLLLGSEEEKDVYINPPEKYGDKGVALHLETMASGVDTKQRRVKTDKGEFGYEKLLIASGAIVRTFGVPGSDLDGILYLRSLDDSKRIQAVIEPAKTAVVIGAGFIGMEVASAFAQKNTKTTLVFPEERLWRAFLTPELSAWFARYYEEHGVTIAAGERVNGFAGSGRVRAVKAESGREFEAEAVVAGIGVKPATAFLEGSGLTIDNGVKVNEYLETGVDNVWAAGDVANYYDTIFKKQRRIEHWDNAVEQGKHAAGLLQGQREPFVHVPYFFSDVFDLSYEYWGDSADATETIHRADWDKKEIAVFWLKGGKMVAAFVMNRPDEERDLVQEWIREGTDLSSKKDKLGDLGSALS
ncbi:MAG TPA: FAD/NAD(P)-binding oxidoreductase [Dehalococcoidia bacterium]|nr:FAD/NAD(P)-binding oxidoreductase [Dehalococcoidia bacterium]